MSTIGQSKRTTEMLHLLEPTHNACFVALMDRFMPRWHLHREMLNRLPVRHDEWDDDCSAATRQ